MKRPQLWLVVSVVAGGLFMLAFLTAALVSAPADFLYRNLSGLMTARQFGQYAALAAGVGLFVTAGIMAVSFAFRAGNRLQHVLNVIPLFTLVVTLISLLALALNIGTVGTLFRVGTVTFTLASAGVIVCVAVATLAVGIAGARLPLPPSALRVSSLTGGIAALLGVVAAGLLLVSVIMVATNEPSLAFGRPGEEPPGGNRPGAGVAAQPTTQGAPNATAAAPAQGGGSAGTSAAPAGEGTPPVTAPAQGGANNGAGNTGNNGNGGTGRPERGGENGGGRPPGEGGPGGDMTAFRGSFTLWGVAAAALAGLMLITLGGGIVALRSSAPTVEAEAVPVVNYRREALPVLTSFVGVGLIVFVVMQLVPVQKGNPPVMTQVQWDSPETQQLWERTCADCHSNETKWPWYSNLAPASWLEAVHIADGRAQFNISDTSSVPAFIKSMFPNNARMNILNGSMPPADYLIMHPEARLSDAEKQQLIQGLQNSIK